MSTCSTSASAASTEIQQTEANLDSVEAERDLLDKTQSFSLKTREITVMVLTRFLLLPLLGRTIFYISGAKERIDDPLLQLYMLIPFCMPTASNTVVMAQIATQGLPSSGNRMENALLTVIFWQYVVAPLFLTANMALNLMLVFGTDS